MNFEQFRKQVLDLDEQEGAPDEQEQRGQVFEGEELAVGWAKRPAGEVVEGEKFKDALIGEQHEAHFGGEDASDALSDEAAWGQVEHLFGEGR